MDWLDWRAEFPILARSTYLNSCSLGALSRRAQARLAAFEEEWHTHGASAWYEIWLGRLDELRDRVGGMLNAGEDELALAPSTSVALSALASSLDYRKRPRVVVAELDFPTIAYVWMARPDVEVVRVPSDDGVSIDLARWEAAIDERTAAVATSHVFFRTGAIQDIRAIGALAHRSGALMIADAYQSAGQIEVDVKALGVDALTGGPLKWLLGGPGLSYLYVTNALAETLRPTIAGWFGTQQQFAFDIEHYEPRDGARRFELGTPALPTVHTALGGQEIIDEIGVGRIAERNRALTDRVVRRAGEAGLEMLATKEAERSAIVMIRRPDPAATVKRLAADGIIVDWRPGYVRVSPHFYNTEDEIDATIAAIADEVAR